MANDTRRNTKMKALPKLTKVRVTLQRVVGNTVTSTPKNGTKGGITIDGPISRKPEIISPAKSKFQFYLLVLRHLFDKFSVLRNI